MIYRSREQALESILALSMASQGSPNVTVSSDQR